MSAEESTYHTPRTIMDKLNEFFKNKATQKGKEPMKYLI
jgi:hypothetical protein